VLDLQQVTDWTNHIVDNCLRELQSLNKPYKYIITCIIMQKNGAGLNAAASMYWDTEKDNQCEVSPLNLTAVTQPLAESWSC
jgi:dynein light chain Tctex-type 1